MVTKPKAKVDHQFLICFVWKTKTSSNVVHLGFIHFQLGSLKLYSAYARNVLNTEQGLKVYSQP